MKINGGGNAERSASSFNDVKTTFMNGMLNSKISIPTRVTLTTFSIFHHLLRKSFAEANAGRSMIRKSTIPAALAELCMPISNPVLYM